MQKRATLLIVLSVLGVVVVAALATGAFGDRVGVRVPTLIQTAIDVAVLAAGALLVLGAALLKLGHVQPGRVWGESWISSLLMGAGFVLFGLSNFVGPGFFGAAIAVVGIASVVTGIVASAKARKMR